MTIGEKIQYYRKQKGLSQEELGTLLTVSRQTVSQWETGQTSPTVDNLVRLKEVLGISVDALLSGGDEVQGEALQENPPLERYETRMTGEEAKDLVSRMAAPRKRERISHIVAVVLSIAFSVLFLGVVLEESVLLYFFVPFLVVYEIYWTIDYRKHLARYAETEKRFADTIMTISLYEDRLVVSEWENGKEIAARLLQYGDLRTAIELNGFYVFYTENGPLRLRGSLVAPGSRMDELFREVCTRSDREYLNRKQHIFFLLGTLLSLASVFGMCIFATYPYTIYPRPWVMALVSLPGVAVTAGSLVWVLYWLRKGKKCLKRPLMERIGFVVLAVSVGVCGYCNAVEFYESEEYRTVADALDFAEELENITGMDIPTPKDAYMEELIPSEDTFFVSKISAYYFSQRDLDRLLRFQAEGKDVWLRYEAFWSDELLGEFLYIEDEYPERAAYYNISAGAWNVLTGAGRYLTFFCDYEETTVYIYVIEFPGDVAIGA
ncbi:MAG: helix-turn-helix transcriptional regulator [Ruminococcaceae bacterium]|nr:helix-turn-helix transcriptional regulator [Oscillospiraceae bacterium]